MLEDKIKTGRPISSSAPWGELFEKVGQENIANALGVSKSTVGKWARNVHRIPTLAQKALIEICKEHSIKDGLNNLN